MTDVSKIVFRWEIEDAEARYATGKVESGEFIKGGFRWITGFERVDGKPKIYLRCAADHNGPWKCEVDLSVWEIDNYKRFCHRGEGYFSFSEGSCMQNYVLQGSTVEYFMYHKYLIGGKATFEFRINIISSERGEPTFDRSMFTAPSDMSNVILMIEDKELHVSKELLAVHSPVFKTLLFGEFAEKGKDKVEIKDVVYEEFRDLLHLIYFSIEITDRNVQHILKLTDRFQMELVMNQAKKHLTHSRGIDTMKKLLLADQYRITSLKDQCLQSYTRVHEITEKLMSAPEYAEFSDGLKAAICDRMKKVSRKRPAID